MKSYDIQKNIPIGSKISLFLKESFINEGLERIGLVLEDFIMDSEEMKHLEGTLIGLVQDQIHIRMNGKMQNIKISSDDVSKCSVLEYPEGYKDNTFTEEQLGILNEYLTEFEVYEMQDLNFRKQLKSSFLYLQGKLKAFHDIVLTDIKNMLANFIEDKEFNLKSIYEFKIKNYGLSELWINRLIVLQLYSLEITTKEEKLKNYLAAVDRLKSNIILSECEADQGEDWYLLSVAYKYLDVKPKAIVYYALKKYLNISKALLNDENLGITISLCALYSDYEMFQKLLNIESSMENEYILYLSKAMVYMLLNDNYDRRGEALQLHQSIESSNMSLNYRLIKEELYFISKRNSIRNNDDILIRIDRTFQCVINFLKDNLSELNMNSCTKSVKTGFVFEFKLNSDTGYIMSLDFLCYFFHKNSLTNTKILSGFVDHNSNYTQEDFSVIFRKLKNTRNFQAGEIEAIKIV